MDGTRTIRARLAARDRKAAQALKAETQIHIHDIPVVNWLDEADAEFAPVGDQSYLMDWDDAVMDATVENVIADLIFQNRWNDWYNAKTALAQFDIDNPTAN